MMIVPIGVLLSAFAISPAHEAVETMNLTESDRQELRRFARDTWRSFEVMTPPTGLPADKVVIDDQGAGKPAGATSPTDIASYLWSVLAAERLELIDAPEADRHLDQVLTELGKLRKDHGFFYNFYDPNTGEPAERASGHGPKERRFLSTVDNGWLAAALIMVGNSHAKFRDRAEALLKPMDFGFFYEPFDPADPRKKPGQLRGGFHPDDGTFLPPYGMVNTEPRIASYVAISRGQVPAEHYYRLYRTLPLGITEQRQTPVGITRTYHGVPVFEGHYEYRGVKVVPSWGGSMFEALMVPLFVPEAAWAPRSWAVNHRIYAQAQIDQGLIVRRYGVWGFSPALNPSGGYRTYGVDDLGTEANAYRTFNETKPGTKGAVPDGVVTPHASFLALAFAPREAMDNLHALVDRFPKIYGQYGFRDSVDVASGAVAEGVLALDQGMILAAIANALCDHAMQRAFSDGKVETTIRPLIADEEFTAGPDGHRPSP